MALSSLFYRMISSKKSAPFWDQALKRNIIVDDVGGGGGSSQRRDRRSAPCSRGDERPKDVLEDSEGAACAGVFAPAAAIEKRQFAAKALQDHFRRLALIAVAIGVFARLQLAFEIDLRALLAILLGDLAEVLVEDHNIVPFGPLPCARRWPCRARCRRSPQRKLTMGSPAPVRRTSDRGRDCGRE